MLRSGSPTGDFDEIPLINRTISGEEEENTDIMSGDNDTDWLVGLRKRRKPFFIRCWQCCLNSCECCCQRLWRICWKQKELHPRTLRIGHTADLKHVSNAVRNQKYNIFTFVPMVLFEQFRFFLNLYFLVMALSQFIPEIRISYLWTYWGPLSFVLSVTLIREAFDDFCRFLRDREMNRKKYGRLTSGGKIAVESSKIKVGDLVIVQKDQRIPADLILLRTSEKQGSCFIRTDQLDGETDWKLRIPVSTTQQLDSDTDIFSIDAEIFAEKPHRDIHAFLGTFKKTDQETGVQEMPLNIENTLWADTVLASGTAIGIVVYTGRETRSVMNASQPSSKVGLLDMEVNNLTKLLFAVVVLLAFVMICLKGFAGPWYAYLFRFILLFSYIIPISLRVNLDLAKLTYCWFIGQDRMIPGTIVRNSTVPEELGRIQFLLSDKTGTLTKNEMVFKKIHLGTVSFSSEAFDEISHHLRTAYTPGSTEGIVKQSLVSKIQQALEAIAICHNVTPIYEDCLVENDKTEADSQQGQAISYQAASPDEVALVSWSESVNLTLVHRDRTSLQLRTPMGESRRYSILQLFPFTSESKRMGIIVRDELSGEIVFFMKGADVVMRNIVQYNDWLDEESSNMAREGLRTLVVAKRCLTEQQYQDFEKQYHQAKVSVNDRSGNMAAVLRRLEKDMVLLCLTGVEDSLQDDVRATLELLKHAGIKIWMLTGDKKETAICIAKSSGLFSKTENIHVFGDVLNRVEAHTELNALRRKTDVALVITGSSLKTCLQHYESELAELVCVCTSVVCCRCSPEQKAQIVQLLKKYRSPQRVASVGDGGNDVSMIQAAHAGIGIVGKEGKQASLAADFSITQFSHLLRLLLVHGRYCYKRSCSLSQFVMHRGLIISTMQAIFSCVFYFVSVSLYQGMLMVAYSTVYTMFPVFSLVMDRDIKDSVALTYPELYKDLAKGRSLSFKTFFLWLLISVYQGSVIMYGALILFEADFIHVVSITFTALIFTELIMLGLTVHIWHWAMLLAEAFSLLIYVISLLVLDSFFDPDFVLTETFLWKTAVITAVSCMPLYFLKCLRRRLAPPSYAKVN